MRSDCESGSTGGAEGGEEGRAGFTGRIAGSEAETGDLEKESGGKKGLTHAGGFSHKSCHTKM